MVIRHQDIAMDDNTKSLREFSENPEESLIILFIPVYEIPLVTS
jgi:hypothetical protein